MSYYLNKFKDKYRLKANIDLETNDYPRDENGKIEENDVYIKCRKGQIYHYGRNVLVCYCNSIGTGRNILKALAEEFGIDSIKYCTEREDNKGSLVKNYDYETLYKLLEETKRVFNIEETDEEVIWRFKDKDIDLMATHMQANTSGAGISPFSTRNLPKAKYEISNEDLQEYKEITKEISNTDFLILSQLTRSFITENMAKNKAYKGTNINKVMRQKMLKGKEFIHSEGFWNEYLSFLKNNL